jgi:hypothetical protein
MPQSTFECFACGAPNGPKPGRLQMRCVYCGTNLTIPAALRTEAPPTVLEQRRETEQAKGPEIEAEELLRKAQPVATRAWNMYARWTQFRYFLPTCLTIAVIMICACAGFTILPFVLRALR